MVRRPPGGVLAGRILRLVSPTADNSVPITRLAPSPTGALHLGNARTFLINWAMARRAGWRIVLRIEDLDGPRVKPGSAEQIISTLRWLGLDWDGEPLVQSRDLTPYVEAMRSLARRGLVYPTELSRAARDAGGEASAPQAGSHEAAFPASLRPADWPRSRAFEPEIGASPLAWRFATPPGAVAFVDGFAGQQAIDPSETVGDFVVWTKLGVPAYQLAVVVDDARQGVTQVVRGDDLLDSAARQRLLSRALGLKPEPSYVHVPLVLGADGRRLAKRHGDTRVETYRAAGVRAERVVGLVAYWIGVCARREEMTAVDFAERFDLSLVPRGPVTFTPEDDTWLRSN